MLQIVISALPTYKVTAVKPENISNTQTCLLPFDPFNILLICVPILEEKSSTCSESSGADFEPCQSKGTPHLITQKNLNDLVRDLNLSKGKTKLSGSRLQLAGSRFQVLLIINTIAIIGEHVKLL